MVCNSSVLRPALGARVLPSARAGRAAAVGYGHPDLQGLWMKSAGGFVERLIRTIRRECVDCTLFWTAADLEVKLLEFQRYFNGYRAHAGLNGRPPAPTPEEGGARPSLHSYRWQPHCRALPHTPIAA
jgi:hypothetical protein